MSPTVTFKCPSCGGYLEFEPALQKFKCLYCSQVLSEEELREQSSEKEAEAEEKQAEENADEAQSAEGEQPASTEKLRSYHCQMCGAEIVTDTTTAATRCYYCHSPVVLYDQLDDDFRPDGVIPFKLNREEAQRTFMDYVKKKTFIDRRFFDEAQLEMFSGVYYPYWYFDVEGNASFSGEGTQRSVSTTPSFIVTTTKYFRVTRRAAMTFRNIARKALGKMDGKLSDGIHPYHPEDVKPYASGYLSGFLAERRDVEDESLRSSIIQEVTGYADSRIRREGTFHTLNGNTSFTATEVKSRYVLLPAWVLTWKGGQDGKMFYYMMNGRTGKVCGKLPINWKKLAGFAVGAGLLVFGLLCVGGMFIW